MGTRILKIDSEMAEKIEVEDGNPNFIFFCCKKIFFFIKSAITCLRNTHIIKVGALSENSGNLLMDGHTNFED